MFEKIPASLSRKLKSVRAGANKVLCETEDFTDVPQTIMLESAAFHDRDPIPMRFTADGDKVSPPLAWSGVPPEAESLVLVIEDPDAPKAKPFVHLIAVGIPADIDEIGEGAFSPDGSDSRLGRNSYLRATYLPPDPPPGHGVHRYVFQLFALDRKLATEKPGRGTLARGMRGRVLAKGVLVGTYERALSGGF